MNTTETQQIVNWLVENGWREYRHRFKEHSRCFYKRFDTPTRCHANNDKEGMQALIAVSKESGTMELEMCGELSDGTWIRFHQWILPKEVERVTELIPRMLRLWEEANKQ